MARIKLLVVVLLGLGLNGAKAQFTTTAPFATVPYYTNSNIGIGVTTGLLGKLQVSTTSGPSAIFQNANTTAGAGYVGIGGLSTSFTSPTSVTNLLHVKDGNLRVQNGQAWISLPFSSDGTADALLVQRGISRLEGGLVVGSSSMGGFNLMQYNLLDGTFEINVNAVTNNYNFKIGSLINGVDLKAPVLSSASDLILRTNMLVGTAATNLRFFAGNSEVARLTSTGSFGIGTIPNTAYKLDVNGNANINGNLSLASVLNIGNKLTGGTYATDATVKLTVNGTAVVKKMVVTAASNWGDFVFDKSYTLQPLAETEQYIKANKHLPNIPSACEVEENGIDTGEMLRLQMIKIEELTLHAIGQQKQIESLQKIVVELIKKQ